jgi:hypothetical protein
LLKGITIIYIKTLEFLDLKIAILVIFGVIFAIFRESRRLMATHCKSGVLFSFLAVQAFGVCAWRGWMSIAGIDR